MDQNQGVSEYDFAQGAKMSKANPLCRYTVSNNICFLITINKFSSPSEIKVEFQGIKKSMGI